ncbi:MAG TPA: hypothetical protein VEZ59_02145 [Sphingopyxis sp.]|nr:hypothetical protein [Sphingopyxis sp.]
MTAFSSNKQIRWNQFRATARDILKRSREPWGPADPVGSLARAMEHAYAAGAAQVGQPAEEMVVDGSLRWDAIPSRARVMLESLGISVYERREELREGTLLAMLEGAAATGRKGERAIFSFWVAGEDDGGRILSRYEERHEPRQWATTSASALIRLGIFAELKTDPPGQFAELTPLGLETILSAVEAGHIFILPWRRSESS